MKEVCESVFSKIIIILVTYCFYFYFLQKTRRTSVLINAVNRITMDLPLLPAQPSVGQIHSHRICCSPVTFLQLEVISVYNTPG